MNEQLEPEILSYREFRKRETLLAWERRRRAVESQPVRSSEEGEASSSDRRDYRQPHHPQAERAAIAD
jgi:hypothetical protein